MSPRNKKISGAMFDIRPVDKMGDVLVSENLPARVNLRNSELASDLTLQQSKNLPPKAKIAQFKNARKRFLQELESSLNRENHDHEVTLASVGGTLEHASGDLRPRYRTIVASSEEKIHHNILEEMSRKVESAEV